jgi:PhnB protein
MAKAAKKKSIANKKRARVTAKPKATARLAKAVTKKPVRKKSAAVKIDPLNRKSYRSVTPLLAVSNIRGAIDFYTSVFGFTVKQIMDSPQGILHAELTLRDTTLMLSPEERRQNNLSANSIGNTPLTLFVLVENVDQVFASAVGAGGKALMPVADMFWGDRCGVVADLDGNKWMIATHKSEPSEAEMAEAMRRMQQATPDAAAAAAAGGDRAY